MNSISLQFGIDDVVSVFLKYRDSLREDRYACVVFVHDLNSNMALASTFGKMLLSDKSERFGAPLPENLQQHVRQLEELARDYLLNIKTNFENNIGAFLGPRDEEDENFAQRINPMAENMINTLQEIVRLLPVGEPLQRANQQAPAQRNDLLTTMEEYFYSALYGLNCLFSKNFQRESFLLREDIKNYVLSC